MNKKTAALLLLAVLLLGGCAAPQNSPVQPPPVNTQAPQTSPPGVSGVRAESVEDYFPAPLDARWEYEGVGNEYAAYTAQTEFTAGNKMQLRIDNGGTLVSRVYRWESGQLVRVLSKADVYVRENLLGAPETESEILLMQPLTVGTAWDVPGGRREITGVDVLMETTAGSFATIEVTTKSAGSTTMDYYARGTGLVKSVFRSGDAEVSSSLSKFLGGAPIMQDVRLYYPGTNGTNEYYRDVTLTLNTNVEVAAVLAEAYKAPPGDGAAAVLTPGTQILSLSQKGDGTVAADFSQAFISERSPLSADFEKSVLQSLADTLCDLYYADRALITVEGKPYQTSVLRMNDGETIAVSPEDAYPIGD